MLLFDDLNKIRNHNRLFDDDIIHEAVIFIDTETFIDKIKINFRGLKRSRNNQEFIGLLNDIFKKYRVFFKSSLKKFTGHTNQDGRITIDASYDFFYDVSR